VLPSSSAPECSWRSGARRSRRSGLSPRCGVPHMLTFLAFCARERLTLDAYDDDASGRLEKADGGRLWMARVDAPAGLCASLWESTVDAELPAAIHHHAHADCFIATPSRQKFLVFAASPEAVR